MDYFIGQFRPSSWEKDTDPPEAFLERLKAAGISPLHNEPCYWGDQWLCVPFFDGEHDTVYRKFMDALEDAHWNGNPPSKASRMLRYASVLPGEDPPTPTAFVKNERDKYRWIYAFWTEVDRYVTQRLGFSILDAPDRQWWGPEEEFWGMNPDNAAWDYCRERYRSDDQIREELLG